eukprot:9178435-Pyramimonas_sp.AAC.1
MPEASLGDAHVWRWPRRPVAPLRAVRDAPPPGEERGLPDRRLLLRAARLEVRSRGGGREGEVE